MIESNRQAPADPPPVEVRFLDFAMAWPPEQLTPPEFLALATYAWTGTRSEAARLLGLSRRMIDTHLKNAYKALGARNNLAAFRLMGWIHLPEDD